MNQRRHNGHLLLNLYTFVLLPTYTLSFAGSSDWFRSNFSILAVVSPEDYRKFVFWGACSMGYFYVLLARLALRVPHPWARRSVFLLALTACVSLGYAMLIPYLPDQIPGWAKLHVVLAAGSCVVLLAAVLILLLYWRKWNLLKIWLALNLCYGILFLSAGMVTSALEVFFTLSAALLLRSLWLSAPSNL